MCLIPTASNLMNNIFDRELVPRLIEHCRAVSFFESPEGKQRLAKMIDDFLHHVVHYYI